MMKRRDFALKVSILTFLPPTLIAQPIFNLTSEEEMPGELKEMLHELEMGMQQNFAGLGENAGDLIHQYITPVDGYKLETGGADPVYSLRNKYNHTITFTKNQTGKPTFQISITS